MLDELIARCYPSKYLEYLESVAAEAGPTDALLAEAKAEARHEGTKSMADRMQVITQLKEKIQEEFDREAIEVDQENAEILRDPAAELFQLYSERKNLLGADEEGGEEPAATDTNEPEEQVPLIERVWLFLRQGVDLLGAEALVPGESTAAERDAQRAEFEEKLQTFKRILACNFYEDNIGEVEIA